MLSYAHYLLTLATKETEGMIQNISRNIILLLFTLLIVSCAAPLIEDYPYEESDRQAVLQNPSPNQSIEVNKSTTQIMAESDRICQRISEILFKSASRHVISNNQFTCIYNQYPAIAPTLEEPDYLQIVYNFSISPGNLGISRVTGNKTTHYVKGERNIMKSVVANKQDDLLTLRRILSEFE